MRCGLSTSAGDETTVTNQYASEAIVGSEEKVETFPKGHLT